MTGPNLKKLLDLLPQRVRMSDPKLGVAETDAEKRYHQYEAVKKWITDNQQLLVRQGTRLEDKVVTHVAMITNNERQSEGLQRNTKNNDQFNKNNNSRQQNRWNKGRQQQGNNPQSQNSNPDRNQQATSCALCNLVKESGVWRITTIHDSYFTDIREKVTDKEPFPNRG